MLKFKHYAQELQERIFMKWGKTFYKNKGMMEAVMSEEVFGISLHYLEKDKVLCVPGGNDKLSSFLLKVLPQAVIYKMASSIMCKKE